MQLAFVLSMPGNNSWNGRWSGDGKLFAIIKTFTGKKREAKARELIEKRSFGYDFGDGWYARVDVRELKPGESRQIRKNSKGFCGYDWMVDSILNYGKIFASHQKEQIAEFLKAKEAVPA